MTSQADPPPAARSRAKAGSSSRARKTPTPPEVVAAVKPRRATPRKTPRRGDSGLAARLRAAEVVLVNGAGLAVALQYSPGTTPTVLTAARGKAAEDLMWSAQDLAVPVVELHALQGADLSAFSGGQEIPEAYYRPIAHALALIYRSTPSPGLVRFVRPTGRPSRRQTNRINAAAQEFGAILTASPLCIEAGAGLMEFAEDFHEPTQQLRQRIAMEMGLLLDPIPMKLNSHLDPGAFQIRLHDVPMQGGVIELPIDSPEKVFIAVNRLKTVIYRYGWELLDYQQVETHLELVRRRSPGLVRTLFPAAFTVTALRQILRNLLREQLSIRDLATILEVIQENVATSQDPDLLTECVRMAYSRSLCYKFQDGEGYLNVLIMHPDVERTLAAALRESGGVRWLDLGPDDALKVLRAMETALKHAAGLQFAPVLLVTPLLRRFISRLIEPIFVDLPTMSYNEIGPLTEVRSIGTIAF